MKKLFYHHRKNARFRFVSLLLSVLLFFGCVTGIPEKEAAEVYFNLGNAYFELGKTKEAEKAFRKAIELDSGFARASYNLARLYMDSGKIEEGISVIEEVLSKDPGNSVLLNTLGYGYTRKGDDEKALAIYRQILSRSSEDKNALYNSGILLWKLGERKEAEDVFTTLYGIDPDDLELLYNLGLLEIELKQYEKGVGYLSSYLDKKPEDPYALLAIGNAYEEERYYGDALLAFEKLIKTGKASPDVYFKRAYILLTAIGDNENGIKALGESIAAGFDDEDLFAKLASDPELVDPDRIRLFLQEKGFLKDDTASLENKTR